MQDHEILCVGITFLVDINVEDALISSSMNLFIINILHLFTLCLWEI